MRYCKRLPGTKAALITLGMMSAACATLSTATNAAQIVPIQSTSMRLAQATEPVTDVNEHNSAIDNDAKNEQVGQEGNDAGTGDSDNDRGDSNSGDGDNGDGRGGENGGGESGHGEND